MAMYETFSRNALSNKRKIMAFLRIKFNLFMIRMMNDSENVLIYYKW